MRGDAGFAAFARARGDRMLRVAWLITRHREDARDAAQDALLGLYRSRGRLPDGDALEAYVHRSVVNAGVRVIGRRPAAVPVAEVDRVPGSVADGTQAWVEADAVWPSCGTLGPSQRAAVVLRFHEDLPFAEIADILGCADATARSHVHRALATLRARLEEDPDGR